MKVAIVGYGVEGKASYKYWSARGNDVTIVDEHESIDDLPSGVQTILGGDALSKLQDFDLIIRSPSVHPDNLPYADKVWSATNEFFAKCPAPIIGVTGTKGKGTTCSLIASILKAAGKTTHLVGNIGTPALEELAKIESQDVVVFELSSFQLWDIERSPHIAVVLGIEPDHLNVHTDMAEYVAAKSRITEYQTPSDVLVFNVNNEIASQIAEKSEAQKITYPFDISSVSDSLKIPGEHNVENASAAIAAVREWIQDEVIIRRGLADFEGLPHRLEFVRELDGVKYYNDSFSSAPGATIAAVRSFTRPEVLILGGIDKGADFRELAHVIKDSSVKQIIIVGEIRNRLADTLREQGVDRPIETSDARTMPEIVAVARQYAESGDLVLLSPGCASFDMFKNFYDRGDQFREVVNAL